jgi:putative ABC transport system permease protein
MNPDPALPASPAASPASLPPTVAPALWRLAWRQMRLDFRAGELRLVLVAVLLAVAALSAVGFFADRLQSGLTRDAAQLMGGDVVIQSDHPVPPEFEQRARRAGLQPSLSLNFPSMARAPDARGGATRLVSVKAVDEAYPLRGQLSLRAGASQPERKAATRPAPGTVFVDAPVLDALGLQVGDALELGEASLRIAQILVLEPDRGGGFLSFAPRVMLNAADLPATGLIQGASRVSYRLALAAAVGQEAAARELQTWARAEITAKHRGMRVETLQAGRPEMRQTLDRASKFLNLVALLAALLAAVAVAIAARDFAQRHLDDCAMLRVLGLPQRRIAAIYGLEFMALALLASVGGVLIGLALHGVFIGLLGDLVPATLPPPSVWPALFGLGVGLTLLLGFGLPPVLQLAKVPPLRVIRRDVGQLKPASLGVLLAGALGFAGLLLATARDVQLGLIAVGGFALAVALFAALAWVAVRVLKNAVPETRAPRWLVLATRQLCARPAFAVLQVASLAVGLMALALLVLLRTDLIASWRQATPPDAPNRFVINLQPDQAADFQTALTQAGVKPGYDWYPMIRGRLLSINGVPINTALGRPDQEDARHSVERELNLSHSAQLPAHNTLAAGRWVQQEEGGLSVEQGFAQRLGLKLGDALVFDVAGQPLAGRISSLRKVDWGSLRANFFVLLPRSALPAELPFTYLAAFRAPQASALDGALTRQFPNLTVVDLSATLAQVQGVLNQVVQAVEYLFAFSIAAGLAVLFAAVSATREARSHEFAVMRACGASAALLGQVQRAELLGVGALAGLLATLAASAVGWALARYVFEFAWTAPWWVPLAGMVAGALLALMAGWWSLREVLHRPVMETLRRAAQ